MKFTSTEATPAPHVPPGVLRLTGAAKEDIPMYRIQTMNKISPVGLNRFPSELYEVGDAVQDPQGILVRSAKLLDLEFNPGLLAIARAGVGVNNIPLDRCAAAGIPVFSTPGANANAVKELVLCALFLTSRKIAPALDWVKTLKGQGDQVEKLIEKGKGQFAGPEIQGKALGVVGLGAIGILVANAASQLGMEVYGYDPYLSVEHAWRLSSAVHLSPSLDEVYQKCDYITLHLPQTKDTKGMVNGESLQKMKDGVRILNFARGALVDTDALLEALGQGKVAAYATDFPADAMLGVEGVVALPHLGASTPESEDNCAVMAVDQMKDYLENGNILNAVNLPSISMAREPGTRRICVIHRNVPNTIAMFAATCGDAGINIENMQSKSRGEYAYTILDVSGELSPAAVEALRGLEPIVKVRVIQ